jgi:hypothetical protein
MRNEDPRQGFTAVAKCALSPRTRESEFQHACAWTHSQTVAARLHRRRPSDRLRIGISPRKPFLRLMGECWSREAAGDDVSDPCFWHIQSPKVPLGGIPEVAIA